MFARSKWDHKHVSLKKVFLSWSVVKENFLSLAIIFTRIVEPHLFPFSQLHVDKLINHALVSLVNLHGELWPIWACNHVINLLGPVVYLLTKLSTTR